jgi:hypothetical protein
VRLAVGVGHTGAQRQRADGRSDREQSRVSAPTTTCRPTRRMPPSASG